MDWPRARTCEVEFVCGGMAMDDCLCSTGLILADQAKKGGPPKADSSATDARWPVPFSANPRENGDSAVTVYFPLVTEAV